MPDVLPTFRKRLPHIRVRRPRQSSVPYRILDFDLKRIFIDRALPGPRLRTPWVRVKDYLIILRERKEGNINSVQLPKFHARANHKMKSWIQILSTPTADTPGTSLLLHFDNKRYIIGNVAEGLQRTFVQRKIGTAKISDIFLTGTLGWGNAGGLLGMVLTMADSDAASRANTVTSEKQNSRPAIKRVLNIFGGRNLTQFLATARRFIFRKGMPLRTMEFRSEGDVRKPNFEPTWNDDMIKVWAMPIQPEGLQMNTRKRSHDEISEDDQSLYKSATELPDEEDQKDQIRKAVLSSMFESEWRMDSLKPMKLSQVRMPAAIFFRNSEGRIEKYLGPMPGEKEDVQDIDVLVRNPWPAAMIETLPQTTPSKSSLCYIIKNHPQRGKFDPNAAIKLGVRPGPLFRALTLGQSVTIEDGTVVTPDQVLAPGKEGSGIAIIELPDITYIAPLIAREEWTAKTIMNGIGAIVWILGPGVVGDVRLQQFMQDHARLKHVVSSQDCCSNYLALESAASAAIRLHMLDSDRFPIPEDEIFEYLDTTSVVKKTSKEVINLAREARNEILSPEYLAQLDELQKDIPSKDAEIITLGTGSSLPSKYRNVSATLLRVPGYGNYLFDCGENTLGQMKRVFGEELPSVLRDLKVIWISHLHADHHLGIVAVIRAWKTETVKDDLTKGNKLVVASDESMIHWLKEYSDIEEYGYDRVESISIDRVATSRSRRFSDEDTQKFGLTSLRACPVEHCHGALAVVVDFPNGLRVAYSGDCRPSRDFAKMAHGATLLIHEATFDDELQGDAVAKKHCTTSEALDVGRQMNARRILLTHFSQRYQKLPVMNRGGAKDQVVIVAFDYMRVKLGDFAKLKAFTPALLKLYEEEFKVEPDLALGDTGGA
ncbi:hypothetical protein B7494_g3807 [Chlorociboria aeruginascens]|nr:hypothetical protein B7494_g3807 [Chlorociboria aeruginascens]